MTRQHRYNSLNVFENRNPYNKLSYHKQIARQLRTRYVSDINSNSVTFKSRLSVTQLKVIGNGTIR